MSRNVWEIVLYSSVTFSVLSVMIEIFKMFQQKRFVKKNQEKVNHMLKKLKPGDKIVFLGAIFATFIQRDDQIAIVQVADGTQIEISIYSINAILDE